MYKYICTIDYDNLRMIFDDYTDEEIETLYDKYNGITLLKKERSEVTEFDLQEFYIYQRQLLCIYDKDAKIFTEENIKNEVMEIISENKKEEGKKYD